jgi:hypothetical protein
MAIAAEHEKALLIVERKRLMGKGVRLRDVHLIASPDNRPFLLDVR